MGASRLDAFIRALTERRRVLLLGGLAIIAHGLSRATKDVDLWLEPLDSPERWAEVLLEMQRAFPEISFVGLPSWQPLRTQDEIAKTADEIGMLRVTGLECPIDIFRRPNEFEESAFDVVWSRSTLEKDGVRLPDPLDILQTKLDTGRDSDLADLAFLEAKVRTLFGNRLATSATLKEAREIFDRYIDHAIVGQALQNPDAAVRDFARAALEELAAQGDPFAREMLDQR